MNKVMITGANRGLGYELVKIFHENGSEVFPVVRNVAYAEKLKTEFKERIYPIVADISSDESESIICSSLQRVTDHLDILINNAGIPGQEYEIQNVSTEEVCRLFNVHCLGVIRTVKATLSFLEKSDHPRIVNVSSRLGSLQMMANQEFIHLNTSYSYRIAKAAQNMLTICLGHELSKKGISVHAIHPGKLKTDSASSDADMEVSVGANHIYHWLLNLKKGAPVEFLQPGVSRLMW
jgi:NAD(P)-dependent dehydrogenase (short-subunit alcohol dehydrogenase family)